MGTATTTGIGRSGPPIRVEHLTVEQRVARERTARREVPRSLHTEFLPPPGRAGPGRPPRGGQAETRVPELVPIRYGRMLVSPFTFFRGAALVMESDLAATANGPRGREFPPAGGPITVSAMTGVRFVACLPAGAATLDAGLAAERDVPEEL